MSILGTLKVMLTADTGKFAKDIKMGETAVKSFKSEITNMAKGLAGAFTVGAIVTGIKKMVDSTAEYAKTVEDLSRNLGISTEESSKLIQMTDDLEISQSALEMGMKTALRQSITPNIEGIKDLAAQYQALQTPAEKAAFALKTFGKNGLEMAKILEKTPDQIQAMADALEGSSLIMGEDAVQAAKDYRLKLDELNDSWDAMSVTVGNKAIPKVTQFMNLITKMTSLDTKSWFQDGADASAEFINAFVFGKKAEEEMIDSIQIGMGELRKYDMSLGEVTAATDEVAAANSRVAMSITEVSKTSAAKEAIDILTTAYKDGTIAQDVYNVKMSDLMRNWLGMPESQVTASMALQTIKQDLDNGKISALEASSAILGVGSAADAINGKQANVTVTTTYQEVGSPPANIKNPVRPRRAAGGPVSAGSAYLVGERGMETFVPSQNGAIINNYNTNAMMKNSNADIIAAINASKINEVKLARMIRDAVLKVV
jgi:hypothetical protein